MKVKKFLSKLILLLIFVLSTVIQLNAQNIPASDRVNWPGAGLYTAIPAWPVLTKFIRSI
jgi:hypothetical protein